MRGAGASPAFTGVLQDLLIRCGRFGDLIHHHGFDGHLARLQFQAEFFDSIENGPSWNVGITPGLYDNGIFAGQSGLVDHRCFGESH